MKTESVTSKPVASGGHIQQVGAMVFLLFIISVSSVGEAWAQPLCFSDEPLLLDACRQQHVMTPATIPAASIAPHYNLPPNTSSVTSMEQFPFFDTTVAADGDSEILDEQPPEPDGAMTLTTGAVFTVVQLAQLPPSF